LSKLHDTLFAKQSGYYDLKSTALFLQVFEKESTGTNKEKNAG
jgi:hypothetical protein